MLHWEDFGASNARRILDRYAEQVCTFNDDMQGTAAVVLAAAFSAVRAAGSRMRDQRVVIHGAGTAGLGIADMMRDQMVREGLSHEEATRRFWPLGRHGVLGDDRPTTSTTSRSPTPARGTRSRTGARRDRGPGWPTSSATSARRCSSGARPRPGRSPSRSCGTWPRTCARPIIMPLSNPTSKAEAMPADLLAWTDGAALVATGSPFAPVEQDGVTYQIAQANNALVFPGLGLGVTVARASRISEGSSPRRPTRSRSCRTPARRAPRCCPRSASCARCRRRWRSRWCVRRWPRGWRRAECRTRSSRCTRRCGARSTRVWRRPPQ